MSQLSVATLNLRNRADRWPERRHLVVGQLVDALPDVICLQEIHFPIGQGLWLRNQVNYRLLGSGKRPYRLIQRRKNHLVNGYFEGIGILTRQPVLYTDWLSLGYGGRIALRVNLQLPNHQTVDVVNVHLHHMAAAKEARKEQVMRLTGWLNDRCYSPRQIIAGDFNELPDGPAIWHMKQGYRSALAEKWGHEPLATFPTALGPHDGWAGCLDYIFLSTAVGPVSSARIFCQRPAAHDPSLFPSDHVGLLAVLEI